MGTYNASGATHGFEMIGSAFVTIDEPLASTPGTFVQGVSGSSLVGYYYDASHSISHGFIYDGASFMTVDHPLAKVFGTKTLGINGDTVVGVFSSGGKDNGFIYDGQTFTALESPLMPKGIEGNAIVGTYKDSHAHVHGFVLNVPEPPSSVLFVTGVVAFLPAVWNRFLASVRLVRCYR